MGTTVKTAEGSLADDVVERLIAIVGANRVRRESAVALLHPGSEARNLAAGIMVLPADTAQVSQVVALCNERGIGIVPQGGRTGLAGGAVSAPDEIIVSLAGMAAIETLSDAASLAIVQAGVTLQQLQEAAARHGLTPGIDIMSAMRNRRDRVSRRDPRARQPGSGRASGP